MQDGTKLQAKPANQSLLPGLPADLELASTMADFAAAQARAMQLEIRIMDRLFASQAQRVRDALVAFEDHPNSRPASHDGSPVFLFEDPRS